MVSNPQIQVNSADRLFIVCGSAAAWMLEKLIHSKGGLYNRISRSLLLNPFNLYETEQYLISRTVKLNRSQIPELHMVTGGVPHYLKNVEPGKSAIQNINQLCFTQNGILYEEFPRLFESLFNKSGKHEHIIRIIARKRHGISRMDLLSTAHMQSGGVFDKVMHEFVWIGPRLSALSFSITPVPAKHPRQYHR